MRLAGVLYFNDGRLAWVEVGIGRDDGEKQDREVKPRGFTHVPACGIEIRMHGSRWLQDVTREKQSRRRHEELYLMEEKPNIGDSILNCY